MNTTEFTKKYYMDRSKANSIKWKIAKEKKCLPMWIADMDFKDDERIIEALHEFIEYGDYGYSSLPEDYFQTFITWHKNRNDIVYDKDWIRFSKGAVDAMYQLIYSLTDENDAIMINPPLYPPFKNTIKATKRKVVESKLLNNDGYFTFDYKDIEKKFKEKKVKMLMLCSPHNPLGRVWKIGELEELFDLCQKYGVIVVSDEVHSDIIMPDQKFIPSLYLKKYRKNIITITAVSKTFSLAIYAHCHILIPDKKLRNRFDAYQTKYHLSGVNAFNGLPSYYGYKYGSQWLDDVNNVIYENYSYVRKELGKYCNMTTLEGSYLLFLDLGEYCNNESAAKYLEENCHIMCNPGESFDPCFSSWVRMNLATSLANVKKAVKAIKKTIKEQE